MSNTPTKEMRTPVYTLGEEIANSITHGLGAALSIAGCVLLIVFAAFSGDAYKVVSAAVYGTSLIILFTMSTIYHAITNKTAKYVLRVFDHSSIFILIAGTYTPLTLVTLRGALGWTIFGVVWGCAAVGILLNAISVERFKKVSMACYVLSGWCVVLAVVPMVRAMALPGLILLLVGGLLYTVGILFYKLKSIKYMHSVWHLFVLGGALLHYFSILLYVVR